MPQDHEQDSDQLNKEFDDIVAQETPLVSTDAAASKVDLAEAVTGANTSAPSPETVTMSQPVPPTIEPSLLAVPDHSPGTLILQWLTYAFWGWFAAAMAWMTTVVVGFAIVGDEYSGIGEAVAYPIAAVIVLSIIATVVDLCYARKEPVKKAGAASVIMIIHAVIFALCAIGTLITAVFAAVKMMLAVGASGGQDGAKVVLITSLVMCGIYAVLLARVVLVGRMRRLRTIVWGLLLMTAVVMIGLGIAGPVMRTAQTKQDRLIEGSLSSLAASINSYTTENKKLPTSLESALEYTPSYEKESVKELISQKLVRYTPNSEPTKKTQLSIDTPANIDELSISSEPLYYRLCVTYRFAKNEYSGSSYSDFYVSTTVSTYNHPAGEKCYDLQTTYTP